MKTIVAILLSLLIAPAALAQALADRIPGDAQIYLGWKGTDDLGGGYEGSHLKAVVDASQVSQFISESIPKLVDRLAQGDQDAAQQAQLAMDLMMPLLRHPTAIYFGGVVPGANGTPPMPKIAVLCDAGADAPALSQKVTQLISEMGPGCPGRSQTLGSLLVVSTFDYTDHPADPLSQNKQFKEAMAQQIGDPVLALYVDGTALLQTTDALVDQLVPPPGKQMWPQIRDALGLGGLKYLVGTDGFDGKNWATRLFISAPGPRNGLLAGAAMEPVSQSLVTLIPQSASVAGAFGLDLDALFTRVDSAIQQYSPDLANQFHQGMQQADQMVGFDIQKDLLGALGPQWAFYVDPEANGSGAMGFTAINQPRNPDALQTSLSSLENFANVTIRQQMAASAKLTIEFRQFSSGGVSVHYLATPLFSPAWAIKDGNWYGALYPQIVVSAINRQPDGKSILDNPGYQQVMKELGAPAQFGSFSYADLPRTIPQGYQSWLMLSRLYLGIGDLFGGQTPPLVLPPLDKLMAETEPSGSVSWSDDSGYYMRAITPFPGADVLGAGDNLSAAYVGETAMVVSILLPSLDRARETANRVKCASNEREIGQGIILYANDHQGALPPDLGTLAKTESIPAEVFVCPDTGHHPPAGMTPEAASDWINANSDYIYIGRGIISHIPRAGETVMVYERPGDHGGDGMNMLYADGHVEFQPMGNAQSQIGQSQQTMSQQ